MHELMFPHVNLPDSCKALRAEVREFLQEEIRSGCIPSKAGSWSVANPTFTRHCAERGYIGMTWPKQYGGHERTKLERHVVIEELLAAAAPVGAHWIADRQSGYQILKHGSQSAKDKILPRIAAGECYFAIGMSEPDTGSDLAAVKTRAIKTDGGWLITGTKVWTSHAHRAHYLIVLVRTAPKEEDRHAGLSQFIIDLSRPGVT